MIIQIDVNEEDIKGLVQQRISELGFIIPKEDIKFYVKTKQNLKAEWEEGKFKVSISRLEPIHAEID